MKEAGETLPGFLPIPARVVGRNGTTGSGARQTIVLRYVTEV
jgi:hypothetical protein